MSKEKKKFNFLKVDWVLLLTSVVLLGVGLLFLYSAEYKTTDEQLNIKDYPHFFKQMIFLIPAFIAMIIAFIWDYRKLNNYAWYVYAGILFLLILTLLVGARVHGAKSWLNIIPGFGIQPSEFAKPALIIVLAHFLSSKQREMSRMSSFLLALLIAAPVLGLIFLQPDFGTIIIFIPIILTTLFVGGANIRDILILVSMGLFAIMFSILAKGKLIASLLLTESETLPEEGKVELIKVAEKFNAVGSWLTDPTFILIVIASVFVFAGLNYFFYWKSNYRVFQIIMAIFFGLGLGWVLSFGVEKAIKDYHTHRLVSTIAQSSYEGYYDADIGYQTYQSKIAIRVGHVKGVGYLEGRRKEGEWVPERHTDFIFTVIAEEIGFRGAFFIILLYLILGFRGIVISYGAKDKNGSIIASGLTAFILFQALINLASCTGIFPVTGLPLPFISAGGSSLITTLLCVGLLLNVNARRFEKTSLS